MNVRHVLPRVVFAAVLAFGLFAWTEASQAAPNDRYTGAFRGLNSSAAFAEYGYRTGMRPSSSLSYRNSHSYSHSYSGRRFFGFSGRRWRFRR